MDCVTEVVVLVGVLVVVVVGGFASRKSSLPPLVASAAVTKQRFPEEVSKCVRTKTEQSDTRRESRKDKRQRG